MSESFKKYRISANNEFFGTLMLNQDEGGLYIGSILYSPALIEQLKADVQNDSPVEKRIRILRTHGQEGSLKHDKMQKADTTEEGVLQQIKDWLNPLCGKGKKIDIQLIDDE